MCVCIIIKRIPLLSRICVSHSLSIAQFQLFHYVVGSGLSWCECVVDVVPLAFIVSCSRHLSLQIVFCFSVIVPSPLPLRLPSNATKCSLHIGTSAMAITALETIKTFEWIRIGISRTIAIRLRTNLQFKLIAAPRSAYRQSQAQCIR